VLEPLAQCLVLPRRESTDRVDPGRIAEVAFGKAQASRREKAVDPGDAGPGRQMLRVVAATIEGSERRRRKGMSQEQGIERVRSGLDLERVARGEDTLEIEDAGVDRVLEAKHCPRVPRRGEPTDEETPLVLLAGKMSKQRDSFGSVFLEPPVVDRQLVRLQIEGCGVDRRTAGLERLAPFSR